MDLIADYGHWSVDSVGHFNPEEFFGFIYLIERKSSGQAYIGRKQFKVKRTKTKSNPSRTKESDWKTYTSSSELVNDLIRDAGKDDFSFSILRLCSGRCQLTYEEESLQREHDVLRARLPDGCRKFFNNCIGYKNFAGLEKQTEETKRKIGEAMRGRPNESCAERNRQGLSQTTRDRIKESWSGDDARREVVRQRAIERNLVQGRRWWTNGDEERRSETCPGERWVCGRRLTKPNTSV